MRTKKCVSGYRASEGRAAVLEDHRNENIAPEAQARYANIMLDTAFKIVFGSAANKSLLIQLLECLIPGKKISSLKYEDKEIPGFFVTEKKTIFDLYCKTDKGERFVVEMQLHEQTHYCDRALFYSTYPIREQLITSKEEEKLRKKRKRKKINSYELKPVYMISILDHSLNHVSSDAIRDGLVSSYAIRADNGGELMTDSLHFIYLELGRLPYKEDEAGKCETLVEKLAFAFKYMSVLHERPAEFGEVFFHRLFQAAELAKMTPLQRRQYDIDMFTEIDRRAQLAFASEKGLAEGRERGLAEGREKGLAEGRERGLAEGRELGNKEGKKNIAKRMIERGFPAVDVAEMTGLSEDEIRQLE